MASGVGLSIMITLICYVLPMMLGKVEFSSCFYRVTELRTQYQLLHMDFISFVISNTRIPKVKKPAKNAIAESAVSVRFLDSIAK
jgi:hypothetical protein